MTSYDLNIVLPPSMHLLNNTAGKLDESNLCNDICYAIPVEGAGFVVAAVVVHTFAPKISAPLFGIAAGVFATKLVLNCCDRYANVTFISLPKEVNKLNKKYPNLQIVLVIVVIAVSLLNPIAGFIAGIATGCYNAIVMDIEGYKLMQKEAQQIRN